MENVRKAAKKLGFITPPREFAEIFEKRISDRRIKDLGFAWLIIMQKPGQFSEFSQIWDSVDASLPVIRTHYDSPGERIDRLSFCLNEDSEEMWPQDGFVFLAPEKEKK